MSCFVVSDYHVSALVAWAIRQGLALDASPDAVAYVLASANRRAYSERYQGRHDSDVVPFGGLDRSAGAELQPVAIVKACDCLDYQASDWSRWNDSDAFGYLVAIRRAGSQLRTWPRTRPRPARTSTPPTRAAERCQGMTLRPGAWTRRPARIVAAILRTRPSWPPVNVRATIAPGMTRPTRWPTAWPPCWLI
jgi:hypothetical protein